MTPIERRLALAIKEAAYRVRDRTLAREVENAIAAGDIQGAIEAVKMEVGEAYLSEQIPDALRSAYEAAGRKAAEALRFHAERASFEILNPESVSFLRTSAAALIREFGESSLRAIRAYITRAYRTGQTPAALARTIVDSGIGLTERQLTAVDNFRTGLEDGPRDFTQAEVDSMVDRYAERLLRYRARLIARTEINRAENQGNRELWRQARERGLLDARAVVEWQTTGQENVCPECDGVDGEVVPLGATFSVGVEGPPLHPACSCVNVIHPTGKR